MAINLVKGQRISMDKGLSLVGVGLGWDPNANGGYDFDLDAHTSIGELLEELVYQTGLEEANVGNVRNLFFPAERKRLSVKSTLAKEKVQYGDVLLLL